MKLNTSALKMPITSCLWFVCISLRHTNNANGLTSEKSWVPPQTLNGSSQNSAPTSKLKMNLRKLKRSIEMKPKKKSNQKSNLRSPKRKRKLQKNSNKGCIKVSKKT